MFYFARVHGYVLDDFTNPAEGIERNREAKRDRWVRADELPRVTAAIDGDPNVYLRICFWTLLFTGLRRTEARLLKWSDVNLDQSETRLAETKAHPSHVVPLSDLAKALLCPCPRSTATSTCSRRGSRIPRGPEGIRRDGRSARRAGGP